MADPDAFSIRAARPDDAAAIADIYAYHVLHGTGTFEEVPPEAAEMATRLAGVQRRGWPWLVAERHGALLGYAYAAQFRDRAAYRYSAEDSVYIRQDAMRQGVGAALLTALLQASHAYGFRRMFAVIGDAENYGSIALHRRHGFEDCGVMREAGHKFGRDLDVVFLQRGLGGD